MRGFFAIDLHDSGGSVSSMMNRLLIATVFLAWTTFAQAEPLRVASLSTVMADLARDIGAERVEVTEIVKPGVDPHIYEPTPGDRKTIAKSQILLASGLGFEGYLDKLRPSLEKAGVRLVVGGDVVKPIEGACDEHEGHDHSHSHSHGSTDPHWWHSISNVQAVAAQICDAFVAADPAGKATYEANAKNLQTRLTALSKWVRLQLAALPKANRVLVTSHDALGYFAKDNGFEIFAVQGISTSDQPSSQKVKRLIGEIKDRKVKAIFAENIENPKVLEQITNETGAKPGGVLYADGLGSGSAGTYEGMMKSNVSTIVEALK
jgi:zinc/manganese transport system substrate-binding protein